MKYPRKIIDRAKSRLQDYRLTPFDWAAENMDFGRATNYETELKTLFDPTYMPFLREPSEACINRNVSECWILKCSRAGASENAILVPLRFIVAKRQQPALYVSGNQKFVEDFMEQRVKRGFELSADTAEAYHRARATEHRIIFDGMDFMVAWPASKMAFKGSGYSFIALDEVSTYKDAAIINVIRKRTANWRHSTIVGISSPATEIMRPSSEDPIFIEYESGTCKLWTMKDSNGQEFDFKMSGLKWDHEAKDQKTGKWNLARVAETAHYETPSGAVIAEEDRMRHVRQTDAHWRQTNFDAPAGRESYYVNAPMTPFKTGDFAHIATTFLESKRRGRRDLRAFFYEYMPERVEDEEKGAVSENDIYEIQRRNIYGRGEVPMSDAVLVLLVDTQDRFFVYSLWALGKTQQALIDHGIEQDKQRLVDLRKHTYKTTTGKELRITCGMIDTGGHRTHEIYTFCARNKWMMAIKGDNGQSTTRVHPVKMSNIEGLRLRLLHPTYFRDELSHAMQGTSGIELMFHSDIDEDYVRQITGEVWTIDEKPDRYGQRRGRYKKIRTNDYYDVAHYAFAARFVCQHLVIRLGVDQVEQTAVMYAEDAVVTHPPAKPDANKPTKRRGIRYA